jgi:hypothetical protein
MGVSSKYWNICRISLKSETVAYEYCLVPSAEEFIKKQFPNSHNGDIQAALNSYFYSNNSAIDATSRAMALLCLRCYVSHSILKACQRIDSLFAGEKLFTYRDLLPFVLNDDGEAPILLDSDDKTQLILDENGEFKTTAYKFFTVEILRTFKHNLSPRMNLDNWAYRQTKQNLELKNFLSEFGFKHLSDWALLNRAKPIQLARLSERSRHIVKIYHEVYRRDRLEQRLMGVRRCPPPSIAQVQEMLDSLRERNVTMNNGAQLMKELKQIATELRQYDLWSYREPLEMYDPEVGSYKFRTDLPTNSLSELDVEQQELLEFLHRELRLALDNAIEQEICASISKLEKSKAYAPLAKHFITGLQLYYCQNLSLKEIAPLLGMISWAQARRVLNPGDLLNKVRAECVQQVLNRTLEKAREKGLTKIPPEPDYLTTLVKQIQAFADEEIFQEAVEEIRVGKNRSMNSLYAQQLRFYCEQRTINSDWRYSHRLNVSSY